MSETCNKCGGSAKKIHEEPDYHDSARRQEIEVEMYECKECGEPGRIYGGPGRDTTQRTGCLR